MSIPISLHEDIRMVTENLLVVAQALDKLGLRTNGASLHASWTLEKLSAQARRTSASSSTTRPTSNTYDAYLQES